jgi:hypothetical protein
MTYETLQDIENCMNNGWSDGLPVIPPYGSLVDDMLAAMGWQATDVVGEISEQKIVIHAGKAAATAVMAGCKTECGSLLRALTYALLDPKLNISGAEVTTGGAAILVIVSGPVVEQLGFEHGSNVLGANNAPVLRERRWRPGFPWHYRPPRSNKFLYCRAPRDGV